MTPTNNTTEQELAIRVDAPRIIVKANPGSGKTHVLAGRVNRLIAAGIPEEHIAVFTYTNAAARELRGRIFNSKRLGHCGTLHAWVLERIPYGVATEDEIWGAADIQDALQRPSNEIQGRHLRKEIERLREALRADGLIDFQGALEFFLQHHAAMHVSPYRAILVDEGQDSSSTDWSIYQTLAARSGASLFVVGDANQALYAWRGASPAIFERLANDEEWMRLDLPHNFRSTPDIVAAANRLMKPDPPNVATRENIGTYPGVATGAAIDDWRETRTVIDWIGARPGTRAILTRTNAHANMLRFAAGAEGLAQVHERIPSRYEKALALVDLAAHETECRGARVDLMALKRMPGGIPPAMITRELPYPDEAPEVARILHAEPTKNWSTAFREWMGGVYESTPAVHIGTVHSAKGREFHSVALVGLDNYRGTTEEYRVAYVGVTRAKDALLVTQALERDCRARDTHPIMNTI